MDGDQTPPAVANGTRTGNAYVNGAHRTHFSPSASTASLAVAPVPPVYRAPVVASPLLPSACRRVLVTGGSGFLGRHLLQTLIGLGHSVRCFDILPANHDARVIFFQGDISSEEDQELLEEACQDVDTVFHTASLTDPLATFDAIWRVNVLGTKNVLRAAKATGVRNLIYTSTTAVIFNGRSIEGACEADCPYPRSLPGSLFPMQSGGGADRDESKRRGECVWTDIVHGVAPSARDLRTA